MSTIHTKDCWWEGNDFHIKAVDGRHLVFKNTSLSDYGIRKEENDAVLTQEVTLNYHKFQNQKGGPHGKKEGMENNSGPEIS